MPLEWPELAVIVEPKLGTDDTGQDLNLESHIWSKGVYRPQTGLLSGSPRLYK